MFGKKKSITPDDVREIVRDEVAKMLFDAGVVEMLTGFTSDLGLQLSGTTIPDPTE